MLTSPCQKFVFYSSDLLISHYSWFGDVQQPENLESLGCSPVCLHYFLNLPHFCSWASFKKRHHRLTWLYSCMYVSRLGLYRFDFCCCHIIFAALALICMFFYSLLLIGMPALLNKFRYLPAA
jgi:hypothetical protein